MKMKGKINPVFLLAVAGILFFSSCDKIDEPLIIIDEQYNTDGFLDDVYFIDSVLVTKKHVLLEDFTGIKCVNCPEAGIAAHELAESLNHKLIVYSIHAGYYAEPDATGYYTADFRCTTGDDLYNDFQAFANPIALIDRVPFSGSVLIGSGNWEQAVLQELEEENTVNLKIRNIFYPNLNKLQINVVTKFISASTTSLYKLVVYIVEDGIVSPQKNNNPAIGPSPDWLDYVHRNVLRDAVNSTYGGYITPVLVEPGIEYSSQFIYDLNPAWVTANCNIIAYVLEEESGAVMQVAELGIKTSK
jgi:hypothetical protein